MDSVRETTACPHCGAADRQAASARFVRCAACGFLAAKPAGSTQVELPPLGAASSIAPEGILRGKYRLLERLGEGAHGVSYLAEHLFLSHPCVVKLLPFRARDGSDSAVRRLRNEARAGFRVNDLNVVRVLDCDVVRGTWYFVMEYVEGADLFVLLRHGLRLPWQQAVALGVDAARGLAAIHRCGLVHRDVKPSNLILGADGHVRVADLGVAGLAHDHGDERVGRAETAGTLAYTAPETFVAGGPHDARADLYSLGATLFHLVTGRLPHDSSKVFQRLIDLQCRAVRWPSDAAADVPAWFVEFILRMLSIEPRQRPATANEVVAQFLAPSEPAVVATAAPVAETFEPRGMGVLPFENAGDSTTDDWLGYALANHVSRALAAMPGVYVVDQDGLVALLHRLGADSATVGGDRFLAGARMAGARMVVTGRYQRTGDTMRVLLDVLHTGSRRTQPVPWVEGTLADLDMLEGRLLERLVGVLGIGQSAEPRRVVPARKLAAREKVVLGRQAFLQADYAKAIALGQEAVRLEPDFADAIGLMGVSYARVGDYDAAAAEHRRQEALAEEHNDFRLKIEALANQGVMNYFRGDYEAAEAHYERAADLAREHGLAVEEAQICNNLGFVLFRRGRLDDAGRAFLRAIETHRAYGGLTSLIGPYNGMGNVLAELRRQDEAREYYRRALALAAEVGDRTSVGTTHMHLGRSAALEDRFDEAKHEFTMALNALEETRFWNGLARAYEYIAEMNLQLGDFDEAIRCADKRIELARQHANVRMESAAWAQKAAALRRAGRPLEADECLEREKLRAADAPATP